MRHAALLALYASGVLCLPREDPPRKVRTCALGNGDCRRRLDEQAALASWRLRRYAPAPPMVQKRTGHHEVGPTTLRHASGRLFHRWLMHNKSGSGARRDERPAHPTRCTSHGSAKCRPKRPTVSRVHEAQCRALGISQLKLVASPKAELGVVKPEGGAPAYRRGHYPYRECGTPSPVPSSKSSLRPVAILMTASHVFNSVIPHWASQVRAAGAACVLGLVGADDSPCFAAVRVGCRCLQRKEAEKTKDDTDASMMAWQGKRRSC